MNAWTSTTMKQCRNPKCRELLTYNKNLCPACRLVARWAFTVGIGLVGVIVGTLKALRWLS